MACSVVSKKTGETYYLHSTTGSGNVVLYYFSREIIGALDLPDGYEIVYSKRSGTPFVRKIKQQEG